MKILNFQERINFVNDVLNLCNVITDENPDGEYHPAVFDVAFRAYILKYFYDKDIAVDQVDKLCNIVYTVDFDENILSTPQVIGLYKACREKVDRAHKEFLTVALMNKQNSFDDFIQHLESLFNNVDDYFSNVDLDELKHLVEKLPTVDKESAAFKVVQYVKGKQA